LRAARRLAFDDAMTLQNAIRGDADETVGGEAANEKVMNRKQTSASSLRVRGADRGR